MRHFRSGLRLAALAGALAAAPAAAKPIAWTNCADLPGFAERTPAEQARFAAARSTCRSITPGPKAAPSPCASPCAPPNGPPAARRCSCSPEAAAARCARPPAASRSPHPPDRDLIFVDTRGKDGSGLGLCDATRRAQVAALARDLNGEACAPPSSNRSAPAAPRWWPRGSRSTCTARSASSKTWSSCAAR
jgi:hypothetical protein